MGAVIMRSGTRKGVFRRLATVMTAAGVLLVSSGLALMATAGPSVAAEDCVPREAYTETTDWVDSSPGDGWREVDSRVKTEATEDHWINLVWHNYNGNLDGTPDLDDPKWHAVPGGPPQGQASQHAVPPRVPMVPYNVSDENGRGSWFLYTGTFVPGTDAVLEYKFAFDHPAVTCDVEAYAEVQWIEPSCGSLADYETSSGDPVDVTWSEPSTSPAPGVTVSLTATAMDGYTFGGLPTKVFTHTYSQVVPPQGQAYNPETGVCEAVEPPIVEPPIVEPPEVAPPEATTDTVTPTVVSAGLAGGTTDTRDQGVALILVGLLLLAGAGALVQLKEVERLS